MRKFDDHTEAEQDGPPIASRSTQGMNMEQASWEAQSRSLSQRNTQRSTRYSEDIEIQEDIEDAEPTFYNDTRNIQLQLNESASKESTESTTSSAKQKGKL